MNRLLQPLAEGGPVVAAILVLAVLLYARAFGLLLFLHRGRRRMQQELARDRESRRRLEALQLELSENYDRQRFVLAAMVAAAPLLGLLGTVTGMISTFEHLAGRGKQSMEGLAAGISEALIATEAGLSVAIPAILLLYVAQREMQKTHQLTVEVRREPARESA